MLKNIIAILIMALSIPAWAEPTDEQPDRNVEAYNLLEDDLGLKGYDPVAYFEAEGANAIKGSADIAGEYGGVTYFFSSEANREQFYTNPTKYEPTYGGFCAWAMANESYADINPKLFTQNGNRMHFFINRGAKAKFDRSIEKREAVADAFWKAESGEAPRK